MAQKPSISIRQGMQWANELKHVVPKSEPTCTLVLTSPAGRFVDVRLVRPHLLHAAAPNPPFQALLQEASAPEYHDPALDWAFSGTSARVVTRHAVSSTGEGELARAQWTHSIDSRHVDAAQVDDQGDCRAYYDSDKAVMMEEELGEMLNPATGTLQVYRETWATPDPGYLTTSPAQRVCAVMELNDPSTQSQGLLVRVGAWVQGIMRRGERVSIVRQHLQLLDKEEIVDQEIRIGLDAHEFPFPCLLCVSAGEQRLGELFVCRHQSVKEPGRQEAQWTLVEKAMW